MMRQTLRDVLGLSGHQVLMAEDGAEGLAMARTGSPDLIILDVGLPHIDGFHVCRTIREESSVPILLLSGRHGEIDKVIGLDLGADDYVTKPFSPSELLARVRAMLRRSTLAGPGSASSTSLQDGGLEVDVVGHRVLLKGQPLQLRPKEFDLLAFLMRHRGQAFTKEQLLQEIWGYDGFGDARTVVVHVRWLREKIEDDASQPRLIETVRGVGYRFKGA